MSESGNKAKVLTPKQEAFVREYLTDFNGTRSYMKVYKISNTNSASAMAARLLANAKVTARVKYLRDNMNKHIEELTGITKKRVIEENAKIAFSSIADYHNSWITKHEFDKITEDQKAAIQEIITDEKYNKEGEREVMFKIKLFPKQAALDALSKMLDYNSAEKIDHTTSGKEIKQVFNIGGKEISF